MRAIVLPALCLASLLIVASAGADEATGWPREIETKRGKVVIYQPQPDTFEGNVLTARAAVSVIPQDKEPVFGAAWF